MPDPTQVEWVQVVDGLTLPLDLQHDGTGRLYIVERRGLIHILNQGALNPTPFLDMRHLVQDGSSEQGLLGLAFHPRYAENGRFFVDYTDLQGDTVVAEYKLSADPNLADPGSARTLLSIEQPYRNHNGGGIVFGPDGYLYIGTGDGGSAGDPEKNGQNTDVLLGKLLRLDVDGGTPYAIPPDNPFAQGGGREEIWAFGLRNLWRFAFDPLTADLYIADVGQNSWEEVNVQAPQTSAPVNYGWSHREGAHPYDSDRTQGLTDPVAEYGHAQGCSVTGGVVVRDPELPAWGGVYLFGDFCTGLVWGLLRTAGGTWQQELLFQTGYQISSFGTGPNGEVYLFNYQAGNGALYRLVPGS
jgi:glucose/arabinose dehydrogenase